MVGLNETEVTKTEGVIIKAIKKEMKFWKKQRDLAQRCEELDHAHEMYIGYKARLKKAKQAGL